MTRSVLCPQCHAKNDYPDLLTTDLELMQQIAEKCKERKSEITIPCFSCKEPLMIDVLDFQNVKFLESNDGYHSWFSQPTAIHTIWHCCSYPKYCAACVHDKTSDCFCINGRIDIRTPL